MASNKQTLRELQIEIFVRRIQNAFLFLKSLENNKTVLLKGFPCDFYIPQRGQMWAWKFCFNVNPTVIISLMENTPNVRKWCGYFKFHFLALTLSLWELAPSLLLKLTWAFLDTDVDPWQSQWEKFHNFCRSKNLGLHLYLRYN